MKWFRHGREELKDEFRLRLLSTSSSDENMDRVLSCIFGDRRITVRMIAEELNLSKTVVHKVLDEEVVPRRVECCEDWIVSEEGFDFPDSHDRR
ncbi:hypothetical protein ILUMI_18030 [Ignelater luminosus]|uniref:Uncharacterized protein n=1 Tax=Ignelater luminosus TaxID=2038154 RepID=A0A8K0CIS8_IGNLU|nr:hypothetical protein ILUMI_18030 [Ignelater luminosus]